MFQTEVGGGAAWDFERTLAELDGDLEVLREMAALFAAGIPGQLGVLAAGVDAPATRARALHEIANSLAIMGALEPARAVQALEADARGPFAVPSHAVTERVAQWLHGTRDALGRWLAERPA